jgi:septal ring factor EnvC (AmiA/AmiB activator)
MANTPQSQYSEVRRMVEEVKDVVQKLDTRLAVHDQKHEQLESEHREFAETLKRHEMRISVSENIGAQTQRDLDRLTSSINKIVWMIVSPVVLLAISGLAYAIAENLR